MASPDPNRCFALYEMGREKLNNKDKTSKTRDTIEFEKDRD